MANNVTLTNAGVNSGVALKVLSPQIGYVWGNLVKEFPIPGKNDITDVQMKGWKNPLINVQLIIQQSNPAAGCITYAQFMAMVRDTTNKTYLSITSGISDVAFKSYAHNSSGVTSIPIQITDFKISLGPDDDIDKLYITFNCFETV